MCAELDVAKSQAPAKPAAPWFGCLNHFIGRRYTELESRYQNAKNGKGWDAPVGGAPDAAASDQVIDTLREFVQEERVTPEARDQILTAFTNSGATDGKTSEHIAEQNIHLFTGSPHCLLSNIDLATKKESLYCVLDNEGHLLELPASDLTAYRKLESMHCATVVDVTVCPENSTIKLHTPTDSSHVTSRQAEVLRQMEVRLNRAQVEADN